MWEKRGNLGGGEGKFQITLVETLVNSQLPFPSIPDKKKLKLRKQRNPKHLACTRMIIRSNVMGDRATC